MCPLCPAGSVIGAATGSYFFGISPPKTSKGKALSAVITTSLVTATVIALKIFANRAICGGGPLSLMRISLILFQTLAMGIVYSIGVNYLLNRFVFDRKIVPPCCQKA